MTDDTGLPEAEMERRRKIREGNKSKKTCIKCGEDVATVHLAQHMRQCEGGE